MKRRAIVSTAGTGRRCRCPALLLSVLLTSFVAASGPRAEDVHGRGVYLRLGVGPFVAFNDAGGAPAVELENPSGEALGNFALGYDVTPHWGLEVAGDLTETRARAPGVGSFGEIALWTVTGQARYRHPVWSDRLVLYGALGGGMGWAEFNDRKIPFADFPAAGSKESTPVGTVVGGMDYFVNPYVAIGMEAKYWFAFRSEPIRLRDVPQDMTFDALVPTAGLRVYF